MAAIDILFDVAGQFSTTDPTALARVNRFIGYATGELDPTFWGGYLDMATALLAAHKLTLAGRDGDQVGPLVSQRVGGMSRTYANPTAPNANLDPLDATSYGAQFKQIRANVLAGGLLL